MPRRKSPFPERPWKPDPAKWKKHLVKPEEGGVAKHDTPRQPDKGWMLYRLDTLEDAKQ